MASNKQEWIDAIKHLRLHFSLLLMPVFLFAVSQLPEIDYRIISLTFIILHVLVYPASNIFNSYYDRDEGSVGGLRCPPPPNNKMLWLANILDASAILLSLSIHQSFSILVSSYILASRLYSYPPIRLKKYPIIGFFVIFIFQGAFTFYLTRYSLLHWHVNATNLYGLQVNTILPMLSSSFQIGAIYPLTQIYQHKSDLADGVTTLSYKLGYRGTFIFAGIMFGIATLFYFLYFSATDINDFYIFTVVQMPIIGYFVYWASKVWKDTQYADYKHTMYMNVIAAVILNLFFLYLVLT
ncbi:UbiA family prenyltransferase [Bacteroidia bacterium]|nr:UbiA family prenyltransferase [Bacteroidia bacterium]